MRQKNPLIQQAKKISMNAPGRGDYRREESLTHTLCRVAGPILVNLLVLCPLREHMSEVVAPNLPAIITLFFDLLLQF